MGSEDLIAQTEAEQDKEQEDGELYETNLAIYGGGTSLVLNDPTHTQSSGQQNRAAAAVRRRRANSGRRKQFLTQTHSRWVKVRRLTRQDFLPSLQMELLTSAKSIAPRHWTGHAHSGFSARPGHSILPVVSIRPIDRFSISILLPLSSFKISSSSLTRRFLSPRVVLPNSP